MAEEKSKGKKAVSEEPKKKSLDLRSKKTVLSSAVILAVLLSALAYFIVVSPQLNKVGPGKELDVAAVLSSLNQRRSYLDQLKKMKANYEEIDASDVEVLSTILPNNISVPELLNQLEVIAKQSGVGLVAVNVAEVEEVDARTARQKLAQAGQAQQPTKSKDIREVSVQLEVSAFDYPSFKRFIDALQSHRRIMDVEQFTFDTENDSQSVRLKTYYIQQ